MATTTGEPVTFDTQHEDMIHDAQMDYYGKKLATCSSDRTVRIFSVALDGSQRQLQVLKGHDGPVWQVSWAHPKFGAILASCGYDGRVLVWKEDEKRPDQEGAWQRIKEWSGHGASVNAVAWGPHEAGAVLACAASDGRCSVLQFKDDGTWETTMLDAHPLGCTALSWASGSTPGALVSASSSQAGAGAETKCMKRFATGGCDNLVKIWEWSETQKDWLVQATLDQHQDWVRDVAFAPSIGLPRSQLATCGQDRRVIIWTQNTADGEWTPTELKEGGFDDVVWRVSWSLSGDVLAVSSGDHHVSLWKENLRGEWECASELDKTDS